MSLDSRRTLMLHGVELSGHRIECQGSEIPRKKPWSLFIVTLLLLYTCILLYYQGVFMHAEFLTTNQNFTADGNYIKTFFNLNIYKITY